QQYFSSEDPVGQRIKVGLPSSPSPWVTIVGVAGNLQQTTVYKEMGYEFFPVVYRPMAQRSQESMWLHVRTSNDSVDAGAIIRREVKALENRIPTPRVSTMKEIVFQNQSHARFRTLLLSVFAGLAVLLAAIGIYGVLSQIVSQRTQEIGIRVALGAQVHDVIGLIVVRGLVLALTGLAAGLV